MQSTSPFGKINGVDLFKTARGALVFAAGYVLAAVGAALLNDLSTFDVAWLIPVDLPGVDERQLVMTGLTMFFGSAVELGRRLMSGQ